MNAQNRIPKSTWVLATITLVVAILYFAQDVLIPFALAVLLSFLLAPVVDHMQHYGLNRVVSVLLTSIVTFALLGGLIYVVAHQFFELVNELPRYEKNLRQKIKVLRVPLSGGFKETTETVGELTAELKKATSGKPISPNIQNVQIIEPSPDAVQVIRGLLAPLVKPIGTSAVVVVFVIFMLLERAGLRDRLIRLIGAKDLHAITQALDDAASRVSRWLLMQLLINGMQGVLVAVGLYFLGVPNPILWGALTLVLRFIPYLGPWLAAAMPIALSFAVFDNWTYPLLTIALFVALELISNNVFEPWLYGSRTGISSLSLLVAVVFWTWLWGVAGLFLAIPLTVCLVVMGTYIPRLGFLGVLLTDQPVLAPKERFYQRLLATEPEAADDLIEDALKEKTLVEVCDTIIVPAMALVEQDYSRGALDEAERQAIFDHIGELADHIFQAETKKRLSATQEPPAATRPKLTVLCIPASAQAAEVSAMLFARLLELEGIEAPVASASGSKSQIIDLIEKLKPNTVCISALPTAALIRARYLCTRLHSSFEDLPVVVGLWNAHGEGEETKQRLESAGIARLVTTYADAMEEIRQTLQPINRSSAQG